VRLSLHKAALFYFFRFNWVLRIPMKADTCSNPYRTPFRSCRTVVGAKRRSEGVIKGCPIGVKVLPPFSCSFGAPPRGDDAATTPWALSRRLFGRAVSGGTVLVPSMRWLGTPLGWLWDAQWDGSKSSMFVGLGTVVRPIYPPATRKRLPAPCARSLLSSDARWSPENTETTEAPCTIYHLLNRGDQRENIFKEGEHGYPGPLASTLASTLSGTLSPAPSPLWLSFLGTLSTLARFKSPRR